MNEFDKMIRKMAYAGQNVSEEDQILGIEEEQRAMDAEDTEDKLNEYRKMNSASLAFVRYLKKVAAPVDPFTAASRRMSSVTDSPYGGMSLNDLVKVRSGMQKGSQEYNDVQNLINAAYGVSKRHGSTTTGGDPSIKKVENDIARGYVNKNVPQYSGAEPVSERDQVMASINAPAPVTPLQSVNNPFDQMMAEAGSQDGFTPNQAPVSSDTFDFADSGDSGGSGSEYASDAGRQTASAINKDQPSLAEMYEPSRKGGEASVAYSRYMKQVQK